MKATLNHQQNDAWASIPLWIYKPRLTQVQSRGCFPSDDWWTTLTFTPQMPSLFWLGLWLPLGTSSCFREQLDFQFLCLHVLSSFGRTSPCFWLPLFHFNLSILAKSLLTNVPSSILFNYSCLLILTPLSQNYFLSFPSHCFTNDHSECVIVNK